MEVTTMTTAQTYTHTKRHSHTHKCVHTSQIIACKYEVMIKSIYMYYWIVVVTNFPQCNKIKTDKKYQDFTFG